MLQHIAELLPGMQLIVPEYSPANSIAEFLNAFDAILSAENVQKPIVYGGSFGGLLAQCWARKNPESIRCLILSGTTYPDPSRISTNRRMLKILPFLPMPGVRLLMKIAAIKITRKVPVNQNLWRKELQRLVSMIRREDLASRYHTAIDFDLNFQFLPEDLKGMQILLLEGGQDRIASKKVRDGMRVLYPHAAVTNIQGAGHSLLLTHPTEWKRAITAFSH